MALRSGVTGTPSFFINGRVLSTGWGEGRLLEALRAALGEDGDDDEAEEADGE